MSKFEKVSRFKDVEFDMPEMKTARAAGFDMVCAEDKIIPSYVDQLAIMEDFDPTGSRKTLAEMAELTKNLGVRPVLVSTGVKCQLDPGTYLELSVRSSTPLKYWITLANNVGIIDGDYYNNPDNEGEIFFQFINLSPFPIKIKKGDVIGQGIIKPYLTTTGYCAQGDRTGGFGSTSQTCYDDRSILKNNE